MKDRKLNNLRQNLRLKMACALSIMLLLVLFSEVRSSAQQLAAHASIASLSYTDFILPKPIYLLDFPKDTTAKDTSGFDSFNQKMEKLFKIIPVPLFSYSTEAGNTFGLAKFNLFDLSKKDTVSKPSKVAGVFTFSDKGRINFSLSTELVFHEDRHIILSYFNYKKTPEYIFGIGNDVTRDDVEQVTTNRVKFVATGLAEVSENFYAGVGFDIANYFKVTPDSNSFLITENVSGLEGGTNVGLGLAGSFDSRDNRYNASQGAFALTTLLFYPHFLGSEYEYLKFELDLRKYFNPWFKHVIALQATTSYANDEVPFYELPMLGGENQMRGYYKGAYRDRVLVDGQIEYRLPIWNIFGATTWIGTGRVAHAYSELSFEGWKLSYGFGLRIRVDSKNNTNLRFDFGFGPDGISGTYINFAEAF